MRALLAGLTSAAIAVGGCGDDDRIDGRWTTVSHVGG
jgi:hypothetical protein